MFFGRIFPINIFRLSDGLVTFSDHPYQVLIHLTNSCRSYENFLKPRVFTVIYDFVFILTSVKGRMSSLGIGDWKQAGKEININEFIYRFLYLLTSEIADFFIFRKKIVLQKKIPFSPRIHTNKRKKTARRLGQSIPGMVRSQYRHRNLMVWSGFLIFYNLYFW